MKWTPGRDVQSHILFYAGASQALWIKEEVTFCESEKNTRGQTKSPFVPKDILMASYEQYIPSSMFFFLSGQYFRFSSRLDERVLTKNTKKEHPGAVGVSGKWFSANLLAWVRQQLGREIDSGTVNQHHVKLRGYEKPVRVRTTRKKRKPKSSTKKKRGTKSSTKKKRKQKTKIPKMAQANDLEKNDDGGTPYRYAPGGTFTPQTRPIATSNTFAALANQSQKKKKKRTRTRRSKSRSKSPKAPKASSSSSVGWKKQKKYHIVSVFV